MFKVKRPPDVKAPIVGKIWIDGEYRSAEPCVKLYCSRCRFSEIPSERVLDTIEIRAVEVCQMGGDPRDYESCHLFELDPTIKIAEKLAGKEFLL